MKLFSLVVVGVATLTNIAYAQSASESEQNINAKKKVIFTLAQLTYAAGERCKKATPDSLLAYETQLDRLKAANPKLVQMVDHSPYYGEVRDALDKVMQGLTANDIQSVTSECKAFTWMLQSVVDEPEGRKTMEGFEAILLK